MLEIYLGELFVDRNCRCLSEIILPFHVWLQAGDQCVSTKRTSHTIK